MTDQLIVRSNKNNWKLPLRKASLSLGSNAGLELCIPHAEVIDRAATIDNRGQSPLIINNNPFAIYVGSDRVEPGACSPWSAGDVVQLTKNVTIELVHAAGGDFPQASQHKTESSVANTKSESRQLIQVGVIVACCLLGVVTMFKGEPSQSAVAHHSFAELLNETTQLGEVNSGPADTIDGLITALRDAHITEIRWKYSNPQKVVRAYNRLLQTAVVRRPTELQRELAGKVKIFGSQRIQEIWGAMDYRGS